MAWLTGWSYRKKHTITGPTAGAQTDYPIRIEVHRTTGSDSGNAVYVGTKCEADYGDIRFTKSDGSTVLDYWLESYAGTDSIFWVEVDTIPGSPTTVDIYVYYGKTGQATTSNGTNTFSYFDDFPGVALGADWTSAGNVAVSGGEVEIGEGANGKIYSTTTFTGGYGLRSYAQFEDTGYYMWVGFAKDGSTLTAADFTNNMEAHTAGNFVAVSGNGTSSENPDSGDGKDTNWHTSDCLRTGSDADRFHIDDGTEYTGQYYTNNARVLRAERYWGSSADAVHIAWLLVRVYVNPEPANTSWGSEETPPVAGITHSTRRRKAVARPRITKRNIRTRS